MDQSGRREGANDDVGCSELPGAGCEFDPLLLPCRVERQIGTICAGERGKTSARATEQQSCWLLCYSMCVPQSRPGVFRCSPAGALTRRCG